MKIGRSYHLLLSATGAVVLSGCAATQAEKRVGTSPMEAIEYPQRESSYMAATLGAAKHLGYKQSEAWIYGSCGMAFFSHASREGVCWSYPTDWRFHQFMIPLLRNGGIDRGPLPISDGNIPESVRAALRKGVPVSGSGEDQEDVLVRGTGTGLEGEVVKYVFLGGKTEIHSWDKFDSNPEQYALVSSADVNDRLYGAIRRSG